MVMNSFDLITVQIKDETIQARPIEWDRELADGKGNDKDGVPITPTRFMTTCPYCSQLIKFRHSDIYDGSNIKCPECSVHNAPQNAECLTIEMEMAHPPDIKVAVPVGEVEVYPFIDPVAGNLIDTDNYL